MISHAILEKLQLQSRINILGVLVKHQIHMESYSLKKQHKHGYPQSRQSFNQATDSFQQENFHLDGEDSPESKHAKIFLKRQSDHNQHHYKHKYLGTKSLHPIHSSQTKPSQKHQESTSHCNIEGESDGISKWMSTDPSTQPLKSSKQFYDLSPNQIQKQMKKHIGVVPKKIFLVLKQKNIREEDYFEIPRSKTLNEESLARRKQKCPLASVNPELDPHSFPIKSVLRNSNKKSKPSSSYPNKLHTQLLRQHASLMGSNGDSMYGIATLQHKYLAEKKSSAIKKIKSDLIKCSIFKKHSSHLIGDDYRMLVHRQMRHELAKQQASKNNRSSHKDFFQEGSEIDSNSIGLNPLLNRPHKIAQTSANSRKAENSNMEKKRDRNSLHSSQQLAKELRELAPDSQSNAETPPHLHSNSFKTSISPYILKNKYHKLGHLHKNKSKQTGKLFLTLKADLSRTTLGGGEQSASADALIRLLAKDEKDEETGGLNRISEFNMLSYYLKREKM